MKIENEYIEISELTSKYLLDDLTDEESKILKDWLARSDENKEWFNKVTSSGFQIDKGRSLNSIDIPKGWQELNKKRGVNKSHKILLNRIKYVAIFIVPILGVFFLLNRYNNQENLLVNKSEIVSGTSKALLTLSDGSLIEVRLDNSGILAEINGTEIEIDSESLVYQVKKSEIEELVYNVLEVPRGGEFTVTLSDGSIVFLNAGSKLRFPVQFSSTVREVELEGEGYFKVIKNENAPFIVKTNSIDVTVLGTEFNISAYADDASLKTTLVYGSVQVHPLNGDEFVVLNPGEQAIFNPISEQLEVVKTDVSYAIAWKNGRLRFRDKSLKEIMDIVGRWYDVEVIFEDDEIKEMLFGCNFDRHATLQPLLKVFEMTDKIKTEIVGRTVYIYKK